MSDDLTRFSIEQLSAEITRRREKAKTERDEEMRRIGEELKKLVDAFERATGWTLSDWRSWKR